VNIKVRVLEDNGINLHVPSSFNNTISIQHEDFLTHIVKHRSQAESFYDVVYSSVKGSASDIFRIKFLAHCSLVCYENLLLISHPQVFDASQTEGDINKREKSILPRNVRKLVLKKTSRVSVLQSSMKTVWSGDQNAVWLPFGFSLCTVSKIFHFALLCLILFILLF
jgi:hypothetical protein